MKVEILGFKRKTVKIAPKISGKILAIRRCQNVPCLVNTSATELLLFIGVH